MGNVLPWLRSFGVRFLLALGIPWAWIQVFQGQGTVEFFLSWSLWAVFLGGLLRFLKNKSFLLRGGIGLIFALLLLSGLIIFFTMAAFSPLEAYITWIKALKSGPPPGVVSFHLGILLGFLTTLLAVLSWGVGLRGPLLVLVLAVSSGGMVLFPHPGWIFGFIAALGGLGYMAVKGGDPRTKGVTLVRESLLLPGITILISLPLFLVPLRNVYDSPKALNALVPLAQEFVNPEIWALSEDQEGLGARLYSDSLPPRVKSPLFRVQGQPDTTYYFRAQIFDFFTGTQWQRFPQVNRTPWKNLQFRPGFQGDLELEVTAELLPLIPHTLNTKDLQVVSQGRTGPVMGQLMPQGVRLEEPLRRGDRILIQRGAGGHWQTDIQKDMNLQGLGNLPQRVALYFRRLDLKPEKGVPAFALKIRKFLTENYAYVLKNPGGEGPPLERFLLGDRFGWASHFATAAVMLLRQGGVPARLVKGYLTITDSQGMAEITTVHQHQWAEFYWDRFGWLPLETCPPFQSGSGTSSEDPRTRDQVALITGQTTVETPVSDWGALVWLSSLGGVVGISLLILFLRLWIRYHPRAAQVKEHDQRLIPPLKRLIRKAERRRGLAGPETQGWLRWLESWKMEKKWLSYRLKKLVLSRQFGQKTWTVRDRKFLKILGSRIS